MDLKLYKTALVIAPLCYLLSGFFWLSDGIYSVTGATYIVIGSFFYVFAFNGLFSLFVSTTPRYAVLGRIFATYGCICGGVAFGLRDMFMDIFNLTHSSVVQALAGHPVAANIIFWIGGPLFPVSILVLGIMLMVKKTAPSWAGVMLVSGGLLFPFSRILRIELLAHLVDVLLLVPLWYLSIKLTTATGNKQETLFTIGP
jgi:hypothetical protein